MIFINHHSTEILNWLRCTFDEICDAQIRIVLCNVERLCSTGYIRKNVRISGVCTLRTKIKLWFVYSFLIINWKSFYRHKLKSYEVLSTPQWASFLALPTAHSGTSSCCCCWAVEDYQHVLEGTAGNDVLMKENSANYFFMRQRTAHINFRTIPSTFWILLWGAHCPKQHSHANWHVQRCEILLHQSRKDSGM